MSSTQRLVVLELYRKLLRAASHYPSIRRQAVYQAIREEFRRNRHLDPKASEEQLRLAVCELQRLSVWRGTRDAEDPSKPSKQKDWFVQL
jgi:hypothetical protein